MVNDYSRRFVKASSDFSHFAYFALEIVFPRYYNM